MEHYWFSKAHAFLSPVENSWNKKKQGDPCVCVCVCLCAITDYLRNRSNNFSETCMKFGVKNVRNIARPLFWDFCPFFRKPLICANKRQWPFFAVFWDLVKNPFREFILNFPKMLPKVVLRDRTAVSPKKKQFFLRKWVKLWPKTGVSDPSFSFWQNFETDTPNYRFDHIFHTFCLHFFQKKCIFEHFFKNLTSVFWG
jgi:hypothetical protein